MTDSVTLNANLRVLMMGTKRYSEEFEIEAVKQVTERGYKVPDVCGRLGVTSGRLYKWIKLYGDPES